MKSPLLVMYSGIAAGSLCILAACRRDLPSSPSRPENVLSLSAVLIDGPETVPPGGNARFSATARMSDGTTRDVTSEAVWHSSFPSVLSIDASGLARGQEPGETHLMATFNTRLTTTEVMVLPAGTYRLNGIVTESNAADAALGGAVVEVIGGSGSGLSTTTRNDGRSCLYGVSGEIQVRVTKGGYQPRTLSVAVSGHQTQDVDLAFLRPRPDLSGAYTLSVEAAVECRAALPPELGHEPTRRI